VTKRRPLGASGIEVSTLSLGSWRTFERIPREQGLAVMAEARARGISFLDDARYNDETGSAPLASGYSEVVFGELFRAAGWVRDEVVVANKLWWEFWPDESAAQELDGSLGRMGFEYLDVVYAAAPPAGLAVPDLVRSVAELIASGKARAWGVLNWPPRLLVEAAETARAEGLPAPCAVQVAYNLVARSDVESPAAAEALAAARASVVASMPLWFGALTGKYSTPGAGGRIAGELDELQLRDALDVAGTLSELAAQLGTTAAALAIAFPLAHPSVASVLFGATRPEQVAENVRALDVLERLSGDELAELAALGSTG
jgi:aryl-alcohol dehydrogenase-like predicted oxidoreductase